MDKVKAEIEFNSLIHDEKQMLYNTLVDIRAKYHMSNIDVDLPYYMYSVLKNAFNSICTQEEINDFLDIKTVNEFSIQSVYWLSKFIKKGDNK